MPKISACIVAYCDYDEVCAAVRSILHYTPARILPCMSWTNGSPDGLAAGSWQRRISATAA